MTEQPSPAPVPQKNYSALITSIAQTVLGAICTILLAAGAIKVMPGGDTMQTISTAIGVIGNAGLLLWFSLHNKSAAATMIAAAAQAFSNGSQDGVLPTPATHEDAIAAAHQAIAQVRSNGR